MGLFGPPDVDKLKAKGDIKGLVKALASRDTRKGQSVWMAASAALVQIGAPAVEPLLAVLGDNQVSGIAIRALGTIGDARAVEALVAVLPGADAAEALGQIGDPRALEALADTLTSTSGGLVRTNAAYALALIGGDRAMELLLTIALADPGAETRQAAVSALGTMGKRPVDRFIAALGDANASVRAAAAAALGERGGKRSVDPLVGALADQEAAVRTAAAQALEKLRWLPTTDAAGASFLIAKGEVARCIEIGGPAVIPLVAKLNDRHSWASAAAADALGKIGDVNAVEPLIAALTDNDDNLRHMAATALGRLHDPRALEPLLALLGDQNRQVRSAAGQALGEIRDVRDPQPFIAALGASALRGDRDATVRKGIMAGLSQLGGKAIHALVEALSAGDDTRRTSAANALDELGWQPRRDAAGVAYWMVKADWNRCVESGAPAVEPLIAALGDGSASVRKGAASALGEIGDLRVLAPLAAMLGDESDDARWVAVKALARLGGPAGEPLVGALGDESARVRIAATVALGEMGEPAVERLIAALGEASELIRAAACEALGETGDARARGPLARALGDRDEGVRQAAATALGKSGGEALDPLARALRDASAMVREAAAEALGELGDARALAPLLAALDDQSSEVRFAAAKALGKTGGDGAAERLIATLRDPVVAVRKGATLALDGLGWRPGSDAATATYWIVKGSWEKCTEIGLPAVEPLVAVLAEDDQSERRAAVGVLGKIGGDRAVQILIWALGDRSEHVRAAAARALEALSWCASDDAAGAAYWAVKGEWPKCVAIGGPAVEPLFVALGHSSWSTRKAAAQGLVAIHQSGRLDAGQMALVLAQRQAITRAHDDQRKSFVSYSDCSGHSDRHTDEGIGAGFPL